ncbi:hypothetical protein N8987_04985 [Crocinitomix sp.]|nr:hypothetical protein [Crocinitomix sp.]
MGWLALIFVVIHFGLIINFALPKEYNSQPIKSASSFYIEPIFTQSWSMFAPCPTIEGEVEAKFYFEDDSTTWVKTGENAKKMHALFRASHHGELMVGESNLVFWLTVDLYEMQLTILDAFPHDRASEFHKGKSFYKIKSYLLGNAQYLYGKQPTAARIRFVLEDVTTRESNIMELPIYTFK